MGFLTSLLTLLLLLPVVAPGDVFPTSLAEADEASYPLAVSVHLDRANAAEWKHHLQNFDVLGTKREQEIIKVGIVLRGPEEMDFFRTTFTNATQVILEPPEEDQEEDEANQHMLGHRSLSYDTITNNFRFGCYRTIEGIYDTLRDLEQKFPDLVEVKNIGKSYEGRNIKVIKITAGNSREKPPLFITAGVHGREYTPPELVTRFAETLVEGYENDPDINWILEQTEIHIVPFVNIDGRKIAETRRDLWWRKNTHVWLPGCASPNNKDGELDGVDLNRNFPFNYGGRGSSRNKCAEDYRGPTRLSEPETRAIAAYADSIFDSEQTRGLNYDDSYNKRFQKACGPDASGVYLDVHSYGELIFYPYSFAEDARAPDDEALQTAATKLASFAGYGLWGAGQPDFLYPTSGDIVDTMYGHHCAASFGFELGDKFYERCDRFLRDILPQNIEALIWAAKVASAPYTTVKGPDIMQKEAIFNGATNELLIRAKVSDRQRAVAYGKATNTGLQQIKKVCAYIDEYPSSTAGGSTCFSMDASDGSLNSPTETVETNIDVSGLGGSGKHTVYIQAEDRDGFKGAVSAIFFRIQAATATGFSVTTTKAKRIRGRRGRRKARPGRNAELFRNHQIFTGN